MASDHLTRLVLPEPLAADAGRARLAMTAPAPHIVAVRVPVVDFACDGVLPVIDDAVIADPDGLAVTL